MLITKSLYVEYLRFPKLARRKANNKEVYNKIKKIETEEQMEHIIQLGQSVENVVRQYLEERHSTTALDLFPQYPQRDEEEDGEDQIVHDQKKWMERLMQSAANTKEAITNKVPLLYQPSFLIDDCFVRGDFMVLNDDGRYDLIEVKAKSGIKKEVTDGGEKKKIGQILDDLRDDVSFQTFVIDNVLSENSLGKLGNKYIYHVNKEYVKQGELDIDQLITYSECDTEYSITVEQRGKDKEITVNNILTSKKKVSENIDKITREINLSEEKINRACIYPGNKYIEYFGKPKPFGTVMGPGIHHSKKNVISDLFYSGKHEIDELTDEEKSMFYKKDGSLGSSGEFLELYLTCKQQGGQPIIDTPMIQKELEQCQYPICFYDYESISVPIPYIDNTYPYQQVVVQYSLHKYYEDGSMKHYGGILGGLSEEKKVDKITIDNNPNAVGYESEKIVHGNYKDLLDEFLKDIDEDLESSTFVVRYKPFENTRNKEIAKIFTDLSDSFLSINEQTFDLMDIFAKKYYYDNKFLGSSSIKKVLPVLIPSMSYDGFGIPNGGIAMKALNNILKGDVQGDDKQKMIKDLLLYCGQDSLAMVKIFEKLKAV